MLEGGGSPDVNFTVFTDELDDDDDCDNESGLSVIPVVNTGFEASGDEAIAEASRDFRRCIFVARSALVVVPSISTSEDLIIDPRNEDEASSSDSRRGSSESSEEAEDWDKRTLDEHEPVACVEMDEVLCIELCPLPCCPVFDD